MRITLVEDNISLSKGIAYRLEDAGHSVDAIANGDEAQDYLVADGADLVILDINLPSVEWPGFAVLPIAQTRRYGRDLADRPRETQDPEVKLDAGADDYLIKPFEMAGLRHGFAPSCAAPGAIRQKTRKIGSLHYGRYTAIV